MEKIPIFISYARQDREAVQELVPYLETINQEGVEVLWDHDLIAGEEWHPTLKQMIDRSKIFVAIASNAYFQSEMCQREFDQFTWRSQPIVIPLHLEDISHVGNTPLNDYQALPLDSKSGRLKPIFDWDESKKAYAASARGMKKQIDKLKKEVEQGIKKARAQEQSKKSRKSATDMLTAYLAHFDLSLEDLEPYEHDGEEFPYYYPTQNIVFEPLSLKPGLEIALERMQLYALKMQDAPVHTYVLPYDMLLDFEEEENDLSEEDVVLLSQGITYNLERLRSAAIEVQEKCPIHVIDIRLML